MIYFIDIRIPHLFGISEEKRIESYESFEKCKMIQQDQYPNSFIIAFGIRK